MKKIAVVDIVSEMFEPYDRHYILGEVARFCQHNSSILRNVGMTTLMKQGYRDGAWETHTKPVSFVCFEVDEITDAKWEFLTEGVEWAVNLEVMPDDCETTIHYPSEFQIV